MKYLKENIEQKNLGRLIDQDEQARRTILVEAWRSTGYLNKLRGRDVGNMAVLMESQKKQILKENNTTADMAIFDTIAIPMIRRQNALMVTPNLISVQPLSYPFGLVFYLDYRVSNTKNPLQSDYLGNTGVATDGTTAQNGNTFQNVSGYDQFYNNANFDLSKGRSIARGWNGSSFNNTSIGGTNDTSAAASFTATADLCSTSNASGTGAAQIAIVDFDLSAVGGAGFTMDQAASLQVYAYAGLTAGSGTLYTQNTDFFVQRVNQNFGTDIFSTNRTSTGLNTSTSGRAGGPGNGDNKLRLRIIPTRDGMGTRNADPTLDGKVTLVLAWKEYLSLEMFPAFSSELKLEIVQVPITTQIHKLKTAWTVELAQDLMSYYAINAEAELSQLLAEQIAGEKDRMIIRELVTLAAHFEIWNADFYNSVDPNPAHTVFRGIESDYNQGLVLAMNRIDAKIRKATKQGGANWILISAEGASKLTNLQSYKPTGMDDAGTKFALGVEKIGTLESKYTVYVDPNLPGNICLIGRKGTTFFDTGYVYAPYIEYILSPTVIEDQDFNPRKMISSRFGTKMLNNRFYGVVYMKGLSSFDVFQPDTVNNS